MGRFPGQRGVYHIGNRTNQIPGTKGYTWEEKEFCHIENSTNLDGKSGRPFTILWVENRTTRYYSGDMRVPTFILEGRKVPRMIFSVRPSASPSTSPSASPQGISLLMEKAYRMGISCFDLPSTDHLKSFRELKNLTEDERLFGLCHVEAEEGVSFLGRPLHRFEGKIVSTLKKNLFPPQLVQHLKAMGAWNSTLFFPSVSSSDVFTQKEMDRLAFDPSRFDKALSPFHPEESPFLFLGGKYGDWILGLGRIDLLQEMALRIRGRGFIPILSGYWATFILPKAKSIDAAAYSVPINKIWSLFDWSQSCALVKKFDRPLISANPFADGKLLKDPEDALSFLFKELKIHGAIAEIGSEEEGETVLKAMEKFPSLIPPRKT